MSRSSLNRGFYAPDVPLNIVPEVPLDRQERAFEQYGNTSTYNLENVLRQNILTSTYYQKTAVPIEQWQDLVDEIYYSVDHVEPWMSGNARGPSTAFNLLYRLGQLKPTPKELRMMLDHKDSPYIRAVGFLYLRYTCNPRYLWEWVKDYLEDAEEFTPSPPGWGHSVTMGCFLRDILLDQYYFETIFPRIPTKVTDEVLAGLKARGLPCKALGNAGQGGEDRRGIAESAARPASVKQSLSVAMGQRAPNRASARELGRGTGADLQLEQVMKRKERASPVRGAERREARSRSRSPRGAPVARAERGGDDRRQPVLESRRREASRESDRRRERSVEDARKGRREVDPPRDDRRRRDEYDDRRAVDARDDRRGRDYIDDRRGPGYDSRDSRRGYYRDEDERRRPAPPSRSAQDERRRSPLPPLHDRSPASRRGPGDGRPATDVFRERPASDVFRERPASDVFRERPASDVFKERPASDVFRERPGSSGHRL
ncbi:hypothetical protein ACKKBF_B08550 [Auxenochlorella protothecoides x Auxenochlorella symbiontica]